MLKLAVHLASDVQKASGVFLFQLRDYVNQDSFVLLGETLGTREVLGLEILKPSHVAQHAVYLVHGFIFLLGDKAF